MQQDWTILLFESWNREEKNPSRQFECGQCVKELHSINMGNFVPSISILQNDPGMFSLLE